MIRCKDKTYVFFQMDLIMLVNGGITKKMDMGLYFEQMIPNSMKVNGVMVSHMDEAYVLMMMDLDMMANEQWQKAWTRSFL